MSWLPLSFGLPAVLWGLLALPVIWWLLRLTPPKPRTEVFPPLRILAEVLKREETPHRSPWWLTLLRLVLAAAVTMRAWAGWPAFVGIAGGVFLAVMVLTQTGPGGDVLVPSGDNVNDVWLGGAWLGGSMGALVLAALAHALAIKVLQGALMPERSADVADVLADSLGIAAGVLAWHLERRWIRAGSPRPGWRGSPR